MIVLYHGSQEIVERPTYGIGKKTNDYGQGFYCTEEPELAKEWACRSSGGGYSNRYELDESDLALLNLNSKEYSLMHWITILLENRTFNVSTDVANASKKFLIDNYHIDLDRFDYIRGYRADDSYFRYAQDFIEGGLSVDRLSKAIRLGNLGEQIMIRSSKAFEKLRFTGYEVCDHDRYSDAREKREEDARNEYRRIRSEPFDPNAITVLDLIRGTVSLNDPRLS